MRMSTYIPRALLLGFFSSLLSAQLSVQITSPADQTVVNPGQSLVVKVAATGGAYQLVTLLTDLRLKDDATLATTPYDFTIQIPADTEPGSYLITALGVVGPGQGAKSTPLSLMVQPATSPTSHYVQPRNVTIWVGDVAPLRVMGRFASGPDLDVTFWSQTAYSTADPTIATIDNLGRITGVAPGRTTVGAGKTSAVVTVMPFVKVIPAAQAFYAGQSAEFAAQIKIRAGQDATWSLSPNVGAINPTGPSTANYVAPASITNQQVVTIKAISVADPTKFATATVTLYPPASVSISPTSASLRAAQTQQFTATVVNAPSAVTWSLTGAGTITTNGLYTAPTPIPANATATVKATSVQDPTKSATATVGLKKSQ